MKVDDHMAAYLYGSQKTESEIKNILNIFNQVENSLLKRLKEDKQNGK